MRCIYGHYFVNILDISTKQMSNVFVYIHSKWESELYTLSLLRLPTGLFICNMHKRTCILYVCADCERSWAFLKYLVTLLHAR